MTKNKKEDWIIVSNTHEPIIDVETFYQVQELLNANYRQPVKPYSHVFAGLLYCHECGHKIGIGNVKRDREKSRQYFYTYCNYYRKNSVEHKCTPHSLNYNNLEVQLLNIIDDICKNVLKEVDYESIVEEKKKGLSTYGDTLMKKINKLIIDIKEIDLKMEKVYMDRLDDIISSDMYQKMVGKLKLKREEIIQEKEVLQKKYDEYIRDNSFDNLLETEKIVGEYKKIRKIAKRDLILKLVDRVELHQDKTIDVYFKLKSI